MTRSSRTVVGSIAAFALLIAAALLGGPLGTDASAAEPCPNEALRAQQIYALRLPDCRAYEQVSPVHKNFTDAAGHSGLVQASPSGDGVTFVSIVPFPGIAGAGEFPTYLSTRISTVGQERWSTQGLLPESAPFASPTVTALTEDLSLAVVEAFNPLLAPGAVLGLTNTYLRNSAAESYELLALGQVHFADSVLSDSRVLFEDGRKLLPNAHQFEGPNLYEWDMNKPPGEQLSLVGVVSNDETPAGGAVAGAGATEEHYTQNTISEDGSRVFFTEVETEKIYLRENGEITNPVSLGAAHFWAATPDGQYVFYTEGQETLWRFQSSTGTREEIASGGIRGVLGASADGSYVYYVNESGNLYEWHGGTPTLIADLSPFDDAPDWRDQLTGSEPGGPAEGGKSSRVTPAGKTLLFTSYAQVTSYDNAGYDEIYLYNADSPVAADNPTCLSCNPTGAPATNSAFLSNHLLFTSPLSRVFLTRNLSADGNRVFFQTTEALLPQDTNDRMDVYEWEREGTGSCAVGSGNASGGCLYLISTGRSNSESYFGDASADGHDVFFFTRQPLVGQDTDNNVDVYDARTGGGIAAQNPAPPTPPCLGEACKAPPTAASSESPAASASFFGPGNVKKRGPKPCRKGEVRRHGKCVKKHPRRRHSRHHKKHVRGHKRAAKTNRRTAK